MKNESNKLGLGQIITTPQDKDAIHIAVAPVVAAIALSPGYPVGLNEKGEADLLDPIGVVDPFLRRGVEKGQTFWLFLYPGTIKSLRHEWEHPAFKPSPEVARDPEGESRRWMEEWAVRHMGYDYYSDDGDRNLTPAEAFEKAVEAGHSMHIGPYEDARDHIDDEWWHHWEKITGQKGQRGQYFSCGC